MSSTETDKQFWLEFIEMYKENPCLWDKNCDDYNNQSNKNLAYGILIEKLWEIDERADLNTVKNKIDWFHSSYRKEMIKILEGLDEPIPYDSNWCYFTHLTFLATTLELSKEGHNNTDSMDPVKKVDDQGTSTAEADKKAEIPKLVQEQSENENNEEIEPPEKKKKITASSSTGITDEVLKDDCETFAEHIKARLRNMQDPLQKIIAIKLMSDIMFLADTRQLDITTDVNSLLKDRHQT